MKNTLKYGMKNSSADSDGIRKIIRIILIFLLLFSSAAASCQESGRSFSNRPLNSINLNLMGRGSNVAVSYERILPVTFLILSADIGAGYGKELELATDTSETSYKPRYLTLPHHITINIGKGRNFVEIGLGGTASIGNVFPHYLFYPIIGYRFQPLTSGNMKARIFFNYVPGDHGDFRNIYFIPFGICLGYCF